MNNEQLTQLLQAINTLQDLGKVAYFNKGVYNSETTYEINDVVSYNGSSYVSLGNNNKGNLPTNENYWSVVALKGEKGETGKAFVIEKTYADIESMVADYDNMAVNDYVMIQGSIEDEENATLWVKTDTEVSPYKWVYLADFSGASGITGQTPNIQIGTVTEGNQPAVTRHAGSTNENPIFDFVLKTGAKGDKGDTGTGIESVTKSSTSGLVDTYEIEFTDSTSTTFNVTNGKGISSIAKTSTSGLVDTYTITYNDGTTSTFEITNGEDGEVTQAQLDEVIEVNERQDAELESYKTVLNALPKVSGSGETITLDDTANVVFDEFTVKGNTEQDTTIGINKAKLVDKDARTSGGVTYSVSEQTLSLSGTSTGVDIVVEFDDITLPAGTYYFYLLRTNTTRVDISLRTTDNAVISGANFGNVFQNILTNRTFTLSEDTLLHSMNMWFPNTVNTTDTYKVMICTASHTENEYEPFTNGPSPNPDYPQDVEVVSGDNTINVAGKNLFDKDNVNKINHWFVNNNKIILSNNVTSFYINCKPNTQYTISKVASTRLQFWCTTEIPDIDVSTSDSLNYDYNFTGTVKTITTTSDAKYLLVYYYLSTSDTKTEEEIRNSIQIEEGSTATTYEAYQGATYPVNLGSIELCKIGDYQDYLYYNSELKKWYKYKAVNKVVLDGSEDWVYDSSNAYFDTSNIGTVRNLQASALSNKYIFDNRNSGMAGLPNNKFALQVYNNLLNIYLKDTRFTDITSFKNDLLINNLYIYYVLSTPTEEEITDTTLISQLENIRLATSYKDQTNISQENNDKPFILDVSAIRDLSNIFDLIEVSQQSVSL